MNTLKSILVLTAVALTLLAAFWVRSDRQNAEAPVLIAQAEPTPAQAKQAAQAAARPTFIEMGSDKCTSCRAMIPVLETLRTDHGCALNVKFVDVWKSPEEGERLDVSIIPTQILMGPDGQELARHTGFWSADKIREAFAAHGHPLTAGECSP